MRGFSLHTQGKRNGNPPPPLILPFLKGVAVGRGILKILRLKDSAPFLGKEE